MFPSDRLPVFYRISWILWSTVANGAPIVSIVYFSALYPQIYHPGEFPNYIDFNFHGINSLIILLELLISALPIRILHFIFVIIWGTAYLIMSLFIYFFYNKKPIYPKVLDWNHPGSTAIIVCGLLFLCAPLMQCTLFAMYRLRVKLFKWLYDFD